MTHDDLTKSDFGCMKVVLCESAAKEGLLPPQTYTAYLPPNHPLWKLSDAEFKAIAGHHVARVATKQIPNGTRRSR